MMNLRPRGEQAILGPGINTLMEEIPQMVRSEYTKGATNCPSRGQIIEAKITCSMQKTRWEKK